MNETMTDKTLQIFVDAFVKELIAEGKVLCSGLVDEGKQFIGKSVKSYLNKQREKYSNIKTLLRGNTPVFLYEVYYPINLMSGSSIIHTSNISNLFKKGNYVTIIGDAQSSQTDLLIPKQTDLPFSWRRFEFSVVR